MLRKIILALILVPLAIVIVAFAIANREIVTLSFDPFSTRNPAYAASLPLFALMFLVVILGVIVGGFAAWLRQHKWRTAARQAEAQNRALATEVAQLRRRLDEVERANAAPHTPVRSSPPVRSNVG